MTKWSGRYESNQKGIFYYIGLTNLPRGEIEMEFDDADDFISLVSILRYEDCGVIKKGTVSKKYGERKLTLSFDDFKMTLWITRWTSEEIIGSYTTDEPYYDQGEFKLKTNK